MPNRRYFVPPVSDEVVKELDDVRLHAPGRISQRAHMVLLSLRGTPVAELARLFGVGQDVVRLWLHRFERRGQQPLVQVLADRPRPGRPPRDRLAGHIVDAQAQQSPPCFGLLATCWTVALLSMHLMTTCRLVLSPSSVRRYLHQWRWRWGRPRLTVENVRQRHARTDPEQGRKLRRLQRLVRAARRWPERLHLVCVDESDLCLLPVLRASWHKAGRQPRIPTLGMANPKRTLFGALDIVSGLWRYLVCRGRRSEHFEALLADLEQQYPRGLIAVALDSAPAHTAKRIQRWVAAHPRVRLVWLPKYAAHEANPVELVWNHLKGTVAANRYYGQIERLVDAAERYFHQCTPADLLRLAGQETTSHFWLPT